MSTTPICGRIRVTRRTKARALGYDAVGNTVRDQSFDGKARILAYGADNRLTSVDGGVTYWHNAEGQRVIARDDKVLKHFVYDVQDRLVAEAEADGTVVREYFYLNRVPVAMLDVANDRLYLVHGDHPGTPMQVTDAEGNVVWIGEALAFGATKAGGEVGLDFRFPDQVEGGTTGYFYNYFRDYDASVGRYLQRDPIGLAAGVNTFAYVGGSPALRVDIFGLADSCPVKPHPGAWADAFLAIQSGVSSMSDYNELTANEFSTYAGRNGLAFMFMATLMNPYGTGARVGLELVYRVYGAVGANLSVASTVSGTLDAATNPAPLKTVSAAHGVATTLVDTKVPLTPPVVVTRQIFAELLDK